MSTSWTCLRAARAALAFAAWICLLAVVDPTVGRAFTVQGPFPTSTAYDTYSQYPLQLDRYTFPDGTSCIAGATTHYLDPTVATNGGLVAQTRFTCYANSPITFTQDVGGVVTDITYSQPETSGGTFLHSGISPAPGTTVAYATTSLSAAPDTGADYRVVVTVGANSYEIDRGQVYGGSTWSGTLGHSAFSRWGQRVLVAGTWTGQGLTPGTAADPRGSCVVHNVEPLTGHVYDSCYLGYTQSLCSSLSSPTLGIQGQTTTTFSTSDTCSGSFDGVTDINSSDPTGCVAGFCGYNWHTVSQQGFNNTSNYAPSIVLVTGFTTFDADQYGNATVPVQTMVMNFSIPAQGGWHLIVDGVDQGAVADSYTWVVLPIGTHTLQAELRDTAGNPLQPPALSSVQTITVKAAAPVADTTPPTVTPPAAISLTAVDSYGLPATHQAIVDFLNGAVAFDNVGVVGGITNDAPAQFPIGVTTVTFSATDAAGNVGTANATVTVTADTTPPTVTPPADLTVSATSATGVAATDPYIAAFLNGATAVDNVDGIITNIANDAPSTFPIGAITVTFSATDAAGNTGSATATVMVTSTNSSPQPAPSNTAGSRYILSQKTKLASNFRGTYLQARGKYLAWFDTAYGTSNTIHLYDGVTIYSIPQQNPAATFDYAFVSDRQGDIGQIYGSRGTIPILLTDQGVYWMERDSVSVHSLYRSTGANTTKVQTSAPMSPADPPVFRGSRFAYMSKLTVGGYDLYYFDGTADIKLPPLVQGQFYNRPGPLSVSSDGDVWWKGYYESSILTPFSGEGIYHYTVSTGIKSDIVPAVGNGTQYPLFKSDFGRLLIEEGYPPNVQLKYVDMSGTTTIMDSYADMYNCALSGDHAVCLLNKNSFTRGLTDYNLAANSHTVIKTMDSTSGASQRRVEGVPSFSMASGHPGVAWIERTLGAGYRLKYYDGTASHVLIDDPYGAVLTGSQVAIQGNTLYWTEPDSTSTTGTSLFVAVINRTLPAAGPSVTITTPADGYTYTAAMDGYAHAVRVDVSTRNFAIPTDGHWHLFVDGSDAGTVMDTYTMVDLYAGTHTLQAFLRDTNHQPLQPEVYSSPVNVTVQAAAAVDSDGDGVPNAQDAFPTDPAASVDTDGDGHPDSWNANATVAQIAASSLKLDVFPTDPALWAAVTAAVGDSWAQAGTSLYLPVTIAPAAGFSVGSFNLGLQIDGNSLTAANTLAGDLPAGWSVVTQIAPSQQNGVVQVTILGQKNMGAALVQAATVQLPLTVAAGVTDGMALTIGFDANSTLYAPDTTQLIASLHSGTVTVSANITHSYNLVAGWNLISFPMDLGPTGLADFMAAVGDAESVWSYVNGGWRSFVVGAPAFLNSLRMLDPGKGYWVKRPAGAAAKAVTLTGPHSQVVPALVAGSGWNLIGLTSAVTDMAGYLTSTGAASVWTYAAGSWKSFVAGTPVFLNSIKQMDVGTGYYVEMK